MSLTQIKIYNEPRDASFDAWIEVIDCKRGRGATEEEAVRNYHSNLKTLIEEMSLTCSMIDSGNIERIQVDWKGNRK